MGLIKNKLQVMVIILLMGLFFSVKLQAIEALWSVVGDEKVEVAPPYAGQHSPFPVKEAPEIEITKPNKLVVKPVRMSTPQRRAVKASGVLRRIRELLQKEGAFNPDVTDLVVEAKIASREKSSVLLNNQWLALGDSVKVPVAATDRLYNMLAELEVIDLDLYKIVKEQVDKRMESVGSLNLSISKVSDDYVEMRDENNKRHVIFFVQSGW